MSTGRLLAVIFGSILALLAIGLLIAGGALVVIHGTQRDADGFYTSPEYSLGASGYAVTSADIEIASHPGDWWPADLAAVRFTVASADGSPLFIGIGPTAQAGQYLSNVARAEITRLGGSSSDVTYRQLSGGPPGGPPGAQAFWAASAEGPGSQTLTWDVARGAWTIVIMNADASAPVDVTAQAGARTGILLPTGIGLLIAGAVAGAIAVGLVVWAVSATGQSRPAAVQAPPSQAGEGR
jgi:hypothetical protein